MEYKFTDQNFEAEVLQSELPVLVDFYADWCGPCKMMAPLVKELAEKYEGKIRIGKLNIDENLDTARGFYLFKKSAVFLSRADHEIGGASVLMLDQMNRLPPPLARDGRPSAPYALDIATHAEKHLS